MAEYGALPDQTDATTHAAADWIELRFTILVPVNHDQDAPVGCHELCEAVHDVAAVVGGKDWVNRVVQYKDHPRGRVVAHQHYGAGRKGFGQQDWMFD